MKHIKQALRGILISVVVFCMGAQIASAAPYAAVVMDARDGTVIYNRNGNQPLHPASLTKMMTLYIAFSQIKSGRMRIDQRIYISENAASEPPSKIGLKAGSTMELRYLLRAAAIKSANDASTAIAEAIGGSEANFAAMMTQTARQLGMRSSQFKNAHGLTQNGHYSSAYDMALLGRRLVYEFPEYYNIFSREYAATPLGNFRNSNIRFLRDYPGADGIKTGFTKAAGYNLVGSAKHGDSRMIVSMFGGQSSYQRNEQIGALLDLGFRQANPRTKVSNLPKINVPAPTAAPKPKPAPTPAPKVAAAAPEPKPAPKQQPAPAPKPTKVTAAPRSAVRPPARQVLVAALSQPKVESAKTVSGIPIPPARTNGLVTNGNSAPETESAPVTSSGNLPSTLSAPAARPKDLRIVEATASAPASVATKEVAKQEKPKDKKPDNTKYSGDYAVQLGAKPSKSEAETYLVATSVSESELGNAKNQVLSVELNGAQMYRPRFSGISKSVAYDACASIQARNEQCYVIAPASDG